MAGAVGIDLTFSGLAYARASGERLVARASALSLPFSADTFDLVTSFDVIYAFDDELAAQALTEMHRVLRPGGHLVLNVAALPSPARQPLGPRRRGPALHPFEPAPPSRARRIRASPG